VEDHPFWKESVEMPAIMKEEFKELVGNIGNGVNSETVFGETRVVEGRAVIPVAKVKYGGGGGYGGGQMKPGHEGGTMAGGAMSETGATGDEAAEEAGGMGMGFTVKAKPIGFIEITESEAVFRPLKHSAARGFLLGTALAAGATIGMLALTAARVGGAHKAIAGSHRLMRRAASGMGEMKGRAEAVGWMARRRARMMAARMYER
jgi:uncharacterized spore protein YtfJ